MGFDPATMMLVGTLVGAGASVAQGVAARNVAEVNAENMETQARLRQQKAAADVVDLRQEKRRFMARQIAELNAQGAQIGSGTALAFADQAGRDAMLDELNTLNAGTNEARSMRASAAAERYEGRGALATGVMGGFGKALGGYAKWRGMQ